MDISESLLKASAYAHPVGSLQLLETHISWVVLTGDWAYKLKKPVNFGFLDYSTLERRQMFCEEELRLNRRWAPQIYHSVVALRRGPEGPRFEGEGEVVEYAVRMRQFPQESLYNRQLSEGRLSRSQVDRLGRYVADFHAGAPRAEADTPWGEPAEVQQPCLDNFTTLISLEPTLAPQLTTLQAWTQSAFTRLEPVMAARKAGGFVRELHGDLHLGNVAELNGEPVPFDGIEFSPALRWTDTICDLAFLVSDLEHRGRPDLAAATLDAYLEESGDYEGLQLWDYYEIYRWLVRAKVDALRKAQGHAELGPEIKVYLRQALQKIQSRRARLVITHGLSGSGKTVYSGSLVERQGLIRLRSDVIRKRLHGLAPGQSSGSGLGSGIYAPEQGDLTYRRLAELARQLLRCGQSVVVDATFLRRRQRDQFRSLAAEEQVPFELVHLHAPVEVLRQRIAARRSQAGEASEADLSVLDTQLRNYEPLSPEEGAVEAVVSY